MAASDAVPVPKKNTAYRIYFPIFDKTGALVSGAAGLDSELSKDGGTMTDCTNEATEIGASGIYFLDLTSTECNADCCAGVTKTTTTDARPTPWIFYPQEDGDFRVDVVKWAGATVSTLATAADYVSTLFGTAVEGSITFVQMMRGFAAALMGKADGMATTTGHFRDMADTKNRITATQDSDGNRTAITRDLT
jgi:hypothetical protein